MPNALALEQKVKQIETGQMLEKNLIVIKL
jgi:hypothetical protein